MNISAKMLAICATASVVIGLQAETWTWIGGSSNGWANSTITAGAVKSGASRDWKDGYNWQDSNGVRGDDWCNDPNDHGYRPGDGDTIIFDTDVTNEYTHCWGGDSGVKYAAVIVRGSEDWKNCFGSQPSVQDGGSMRLESAIKANLQYVFPKGSMTVHVADGGTLTLNYLKDNKTTARPVTKTGGGIWALRDASNAISYWTTFDLQGGMLLCSATNQLDNTSTSFTFNGPNTTLDLAGFNQNLKDAALLETAEAVGHSITSSAAACLTLSGTQDDTTFSGVLVGAAGLCWNPDDSTKVLTLSAMSHGTSGSLIVSNGVLCLPSFAALPNVTLDLESGKLGLTAGTFLSLQSVVVDDAAVPDGVYTGSGAQGTQVAWIDGAGILSVGDPLSPASASADWTGTGNMTVPANWDGASVLPPIQDASTLMCVKSGASATVDLDAWVAGVDISPAVTAFSFLPSSAHELWIGVNGFATPGVGGTYSLEAPVRLTGTQPWTVAANDTLKVKAPLRTAIPGTVTVGGGGTYSLEAGSPDFVNDVTVTSGTVHVKADYALGGADGSTFFTNTTVTFFGCTQTRPFACYNGAIFKSSAGATNVFLGAVSITANGELNCNGGKTVFAGGLNFGPQDAIVFNGNGTIVVTNKPITGGARRRHNFTSGSTHLYTPSNSINYAQQGWISGNGTTFYTHVTNAIHNSLMNLAGNQPGGSVWDLCGCDQRVASIQCGRGNNGSGEQAVRWKTSTQPGTIRSDLPAVLHIIDENFRTNPNSQSSPSSTNWAYFVGQAGISKEGPYKSHWLMQECSSSGMVQVTQGELYIAKRFIDGEGNDYGQGSWTNASKAVAKDKGTLVFQHSACIGRHTDVEIGTGGKLRLEDGVVQRCHDLYLPDGGGVLVKQRIGTWGSTASTAENRNDTYFSGTGQLVVLGDGKGLVITFK